VAQVVLPSAQHFMPHADFAADSFLQQVDEQPAMTDTTQMRAMNVVIDFIIFIWLDVQAVRSSPNHAVCNYGQPPAS